MSPSTPSTSPFTLPSYKFHHSGSSSNIVKDHLIETKSLSRRASQQITQIMLKNRSRSKLLNIAKSISLLAVIILFCIQFNQGSSINKFIHFNLQNFDSTNTFQSRDIIQTLDLSQPNELLDSIKTILIKNEPIFDEQISINTDKLEFLQDLKKTQPDKVFTEKLLIEDHFMKLTESQETSLLKAHSNLFIDIYSKMHNLIKIFHQYFEYGQNGVIIYNNHDLNFKESIIASRLTIDSLLKTSPASAQFQIIFHKIDDLENDDLQKLCNLNKISCVHLQSDSLLTQYPQLNDSILKKISILLSNKFDKLIILQSGSIVLNNIDELLNLENQNMVFWSEQNDKRLTNPIFYSITENNNVYGHKRERIRHGKDETFKYFVANNNNNNNEQESDIAFHDLEDTLVDSTTDSSIVFINKKTNLSVIILSMYYDFYNTIYYPLLMSSLPSTLSNTVAVDAGIFNTTSANCIDNAFSETLIASSFSSNSKYYQVNKRQVAINNGVLNFNPVQDLKSLNDYYNDNLKALLPSNLEIKANVFNPDNLNDYMNKDADIKPLILSNIDFKEIFNKEKFFNNVFDHDFYLNNNQVDPDLILSDAILNLKKSI